MPQADNLNRDTGGFSNGSLNEYIEPGQLYIFGISIDEYQNFKPLYNAVKDFDNFVSILEKRYGFLKKNLIHLTNGQATLENISQHFHQLIDQIKPADSLIVYFSGHGIFEKKINEGYWIPFDGKPNSVVSFMPNSSIIRYIESIQSLHTLLIVDSCFSGSLFGSVRNANTVKKQLFGIASRWVLTSGRNQPVGDGEQGKNSPFAESLLYHLGRNTAATLGISDLYPLIINQVGNNNEQIPRCEPIRNVGHKGGEFIFFLNGEVPPDFTIPNPIFSEHSTHRRHKDKPFIRNVLMVTGLIVLVLSGIYYVPQWFTNPATDKRETGKNEDKVNDTTEIIHDAPKTTELPIETKKNPQTNKNETPGSKTGNTTKSAIKTVIPESQKQKEKPDTGTKEPKPKTETLPDVDIICYTNLPELSITIINEEKVKQLTYKANESGEIRIHYPESWLNDAAKIRYRKKDGKEDHRTISLSGDCFPIPDF